MQRRSYAKPIIRLVKDHDHRSGHDLIRLSVEHPAPIVSDVIRYDDAIHKATNTEYLIIQQMLDDYERGTGTYLIRDALNVLSNKRANDTGERAIHQAIGYLEYYLREHAAAKLTPANYTEFIEGGSRNTPSAQALYGRPESMPTTVRSSASLRKWLDSTNNPYVPTIDDPHDDDADTAIWSLPGGN